MLPQVNGHGVADTPMCEAAYGANVAMGFISAAVQDWTYHVALDPGAGVHQWWEAGRVRR